MKRLSLTLAVALFASGASFAQAAAPSAAQVSVPRWIRFSGQVKAQQTTVGITFTLHKGEQDNSALWVETQNVRVDAEGKYTVLLGSTKPEGMPTDLFTSGEAQWLAIHVDGEPEKRVLLVSVPYALKAAEAETLAGHAASDFVTTSNLSTAVQQEMQKSDPASAAKSGTTVRPRANVVPTNTATNFTDSTTSQVVQITQNSTGAALVANATSNNAVRATNTSGTTVSVTNNGATGSTNGVLASVAAPGGVALRGKANATTGTNYGVYGTTSSAAGFGVYGQNLPNTGAGIGVVGKTMGTSGIGVRGFASNTTGTSQGVQAQTASPDGIGLVARNTAGGQLISGQTGGGFTEVFAVDGAGNITGNSLSASLVQGASSDSNGYGGLFSGASGGTAVSASGGVASGSGKTGGSGIIATGGTLDLGVTSAFGGDGADFFGGDGDAGTGNGVSGTGGNVANAATITAGVGGYFIGGNPSGDGIYAAPAPGGTGNAATLDGPVVVNGALTSSGTVMRIDHPLDPANAYLDHVCVQSSESINVYTGNIVLGANGIGTVVLPRWFEAVNADFRYQLTPVGGPASLYISREIHDGQFAIAGGRPGLKVSWTITALRHDAYSTAHPIQAEVPKQGVERGRYLHPELYGAGAEKRIGEKPKPRVRFKTVKPNTASSNP